VADYRAVVFGLPEDAAAGYALFRQEPECIYLRHLFIKSEHRRKGLGRASMALLWEEVWNRPNRVRIDVLTGNEAGRAFWQAMGFRDYAIPMEADTPPSPKS
jgi:GNAT superfamily N-acetyltransferase